MPQSYWKFGGWRLVLTANCWFWFWFWSHCRLPKFCSDGGGVLQWRNRELGKTARCPRIPKKGQAIGYLYLVAGTERGTCGGDKALS
jgi:hypothetical protein